MFRFRVQGSGFKGTGLYSGIRFDPSRHIATSASVAFRAFRAFKGVGFEGSSGLGL